LFHTCFKRITASDQILGGSAVQALVELIAGLIALLAAATLSQFGVDLDAPRKADREVHRVHDCRDAPAAARLVASDAGRQSC
jgi:hypothetical protein